MSEDPAKANGTSTKEATPEEYDAFEELARKLIAVPKDEIDRKVAAAKNGNGHH